MIHYKDYPKMLEAIKQLMLVEQECKRGCDRSKYIEKIDWCVKNLPHCWELHDKARRVAEEIISDCDFEKSYWFNNRK